MGNISVDYDVLNQKGSPAWYSDVYANIPAPGYKGRMFISIDTYAFYRDNGTGWDLVGGPGTGTITGSGASGQVTYFNGSDTIGGSNNLFWDITNARLGIGTATPGSPLDIHSTGTAAQFNGTTTNNAFVFFQNAGTSKWRIGNLYNSGANDYQIYDVLNATARLTIKNTGATTLTGTFTATSLIKSGGTSSQILLADGTTTPTSTFGAGSVTSVSALTLGTSGTDLTSSVANSTTTPVITLNVPTASATNRGVLASADWTTFNSKQGTITLTTTGTSGAATFTSNTLNIPNYGSALSGYLPLTGGTLTGALNGTSAVFSSSVTATSFEVGNGQYYTARRSSGNLLINLLGIEIGTDNTRIVSTNDFNIVNGSLVSQFKIAASGAATFSSSVTALEFGASSGIYVAKNGSNTQGSGPYFLLANASASQLWYQQLNASNGLDFWYNGSVKLNIASTGAATFSSSIASSISGSGDNAFLLATGSGTGARYSYIANDGAAAIFGIEKAAGGAILGGSSAYATVLYSNNATPLQLGTNQLVRMTITSGGNVGIGTSSPLSLLHIASADTDEGLRLTRANGTFGFRFTRTGNIQGTLADGTTFQTAISLTEGNASQNQYLALQPTAGNVLIGSSSDNGTKLQVTSSINVTTANFNTASSVVQLYGYYSTYGGAILQTLNASQTATIPLRLESSILNATGRANFLAATDNALFSLNSGGTLYTVGFSPTATASSTNTLTLTNGTTTWIYTGSGAATWTLPNPSGNNQIYWIKNAGTGAITLTAYSGTNIINNSAASVSTVSIAVGATAVIAQDGNVKSYQLQ